MPSEPDVIIVPPEVTRIVVVSDTHMPRMAKSLPAPLREALATAGTVLHAGDFVTMAAVEALEAYAPVIGVAGNNDDERIRARFPERQLVAWRSYRIGLVHGHAGSGRTTPERARRTFEGDDVDAIVFGHSHIPLLERTEGMLLFNPGSPTDRRRQAHYSFGILEAGDGLVARHEYYAEK